MGELPLFLQLIMLLWSYYRVVFKDPGSVPENWRAVLPEDALEAGSSLNARSDCVVDTDGLDRRAFCNYCQNGKPPRCHHCSVCKPTFLSAWYYQCSWLVSVMLIFCMYLICHWMFFFASLQFCGPLLCHKESYFSLKNDVVFSIL